MLAGNRTWGRAEGDVTQPVGIVAFDAKRVTRVVDGKKIESRRAGRGVFCYPDWEEARQCLLAWNQRKADEARKMIEKRNLLTLSSWPDVQRGCAEHALVLCVRQPRWLETLKPPATPPDIDS